MTFRLSFGGELRAIRAAGPARPSVRWPSPRPTRPKTDEGVLRTLAHRVAHFYPRLESSSDAVRRRLVEELTYFRPRDHRFYPAFFRYLLHDVSADLRFDAARRLAYQTGRTEPRGLPKPIWVPMHGLVDPRSEGSVARLRKRTTAGGGKIIWGIEALGLLKDQASKKLFERYFDAGSQKLRLQAALAALRLGARDACEVLGELAMEKPEEGAQMVPVLAAEALVRTEHPDHLETLIELIEEWDWSGYPFGPQQILEDLTSAFKETPETWRAWWKRQNSTERSLNHPRA